MIKHIPNILTIVRFILIPFIVASMLVQNYLLAFILFTLSAITDVTDGFIARKFNAISNFGKLMDPLADKLTQIAVLTTLSLQNVIPVLILIIVLLKESIMVCGASFLYGKDIVVYSRWYGKLATVLLYLAIVASMLTKQFANSINNPILLNIATPLYALALFTTIFALIMYIRTLVTKGFINKDDLQKEVIVEKKEKE